VTIILNRLFHFLTKVNNPAPLHGAVMLMVILLILIGDSFRLFIYAFQPEPLISNKYAYLPIAVVLYFLINAYAKKNIEAIIDHEVRFALRKNLLVALIFITVTVSFIWLANINREKIKPKTLQPTLKWNP